MATIQSLTVDIREGDIPEGWKAVRFGFAQQGDWYVCSLGIDQWTSDTPSPYPCIIVERIEEPTPEFKVGDWVRLNDDIDSFPNQPEDRPYRIKGTVCNGELFQLEGYPHYSSSSGIEPTRLKHCDPPKPTPPKWLNKGEKLTQDGFAVDHWGLASRDVTYNEDYEWVGFGDSTDITKYVKRGAIEIPPEFEFLPWELCIVEGVAE